MVLGSSSSSGLNSMVGNSVNSVSEDFLSEGRVVRDDTSGQVSLLLFKDLKYSFLLAVGEFGDNLEGTEELSSQKLEFFGASEVLEGYENGGRFVSSVLGRNGMVLEGLSSEQELSTFEFHTSINVSLNLLSRPGDDGSAGEVFESSLASLHLHFF